MNTKIILISSPTNVSSEICRLTDLFECGLKQFHIRKPGFNESEMIKYITSIPEKYRKYLVLHSHFHLAREYNLKGIQVGIKRIDQAKEYKNTFEYFGYSAHSFKEIDENKESYTHFFLSPVFNSISKSDYNTRFSVTEIKSYLQENNKLAIIALGGIETKNSKECLNWGFSAIALLGAVWLQDDPVLAFEEIQASIAN